MSHDSSSGDHFARYGHPVPRSGSQVRVKEDSEKQQSSRKVTAMSVPNQRVAEQFTPPDLKRAGQGDYGFVRSHYGSLAITDSGREKRGVKDARFSLNPLQRDPLAVLQEESRVIEERVQERIVAVADQVRMDAHEEGYNDGLKRGFEEAFRKFQDEGARELDRFKAFLNECESAKENLFRANEQAILQILLRMGRMILLREIKEDQDYLLRLSREMLGRVGVRENVKIRVRSEDLAIAQKLKEGLEKDLGEFRNLKVESSSVIREGGVIVETDWSTIDAAVETQFRGVFDSFLESSSSGDSEESSGAEG